MTADFFRNRLDQMIDLRHPLAVLSNRMPWQELEASLAHRFARQVRAGKRVEDVDLFGPAVSVAGAVGVTPTALNHAAMWGFGSCPCAASQAAKTGAVMWWRTTFLCCAGWV